MRQSPGWSADQDLAPPSKASLRWWREVGLIAFFYLAYSVVRNTQGSATTSEARALANALRVIRLEEVLGFYRERAVQGAFLGWRAFIEFWNFFYGTFHFVVTVFALAFLFRKHPQRYVPWRNALAITTTLALIGFALYPLMPPRLLPASYGFVDTLGTFGSPWSFESGPVSTVSNQFAAMPSLHFAWSLWCALALAPVLRPVWAKALAAAYPLLTLFAVVVTANHFLLDAMVGAFVLAVGWAVAFVLIPRMGSLRT